MRSRLSSASVFVLRVSDGGTDPDATFSMLLAASLFVDFFFFFLSMENGLDIIGEEWIRYNWRRMD
jgi:hypothetical protein